MRDRRWAAGLCYGLLIFGVSIGVAACDASTEADTGSTDVVPGADAGPAADDAGPTDDQTSQPDTNDSGDQTASEDATGPADATAASDTEGSPPGGRRRPRRHL